MTDISVPEGAVIISTETMKVAIVGSTVLVMDNRKRLSGVRLLGVRFPSSHSVVCRGGEVVVDDITLRSGEDGKTTFTLRDPPLSITPRPWEVLSVDGGRVVVSEEYDERIHGKMNMHIIGVATGVQNVSFDDGDDGEDSGGASLQMTVNGTNITINHAARATTFVGMAGEIVNNFF